MGKTSYLWWYEDPEEMDLWRMLNSLTQEERELPRYKDTCLRMAKRYGNIYFFKPFPAQEPIHKETKQKIFIHGNNSSGKSYCAAAYVAYEFIGWSPFREVKPAKYGNRLIWAFSPTESTQRSSSQVHLFSVGASNDIGLLPPLDTITKNGGIVRWNRNGVLDRVELPNGDAIEFKSAEQAQLAVAASGLDLVWLDECPKAYIYDESWARVIRKDGKVIMSFLLDDPQDHYVVTDLYTNHLAEVKNSGDSLSSFYFLTIEDNLSLDKSKITQYKGGVSKDSRIWRFSDGGKFNTTPRGMRVYSNFHEEIHMVDNLADKYDPMRTFWRAWDLGKNRPCCITAQIDSLGRIQCMLTILGQNRQITDFIDDVELYFNELFPTFIHKQEILPHDARRRYDVSPLSVEDIFKSKVPKLNTDVIYVNKEPAVDLANDRLSRLKEGIPMITIDPEHSSLLAQCCMMYTRDDKGKLRKDEYYEHISDAFKLLMSYLNRLVHETYTTKEPEPQYFRPLGDKSASTKRKPGSSIFQTYLERS